MTALQRAMPQKIGLDIFEAHLLETVEREFNQPFRPRMRRIKRRAAVERLFPAIGIKINVLVFVIRARVVRIIAATAKGGKGREINPSLLMIGLAVINKLFQLRVAELVPAGNQADVSHTDRKSTRL